VGRDFGGHFERHRIYEIDHLVSNRLKHVNGVSLRDFKEKTINQPSTGMIEERPEGDLDGISNKSIIKQ
jgi:hypothetical protein